MNYLIHYVHVGWMVYRNPKVYRMTAFDSMSMSTRSQELSMPVSLGLLYVHFAMPLKARREDGL